MNEPIRRMLPAWMILAVGLLASVLAGLQVKHQIDDDAKRHFAFACDQLSLKISERLGAYALILRGAAGLFVASDRVSRHEWQTYVDTLRADGSIAGVQGIGFAELIQPEQLAAHIARVRGEGFPNYELRPPGARTPISSIVFLEPFNERNQRAFGFDMLSEPVRRAAMEQARDSGRAALSGKVELLQENGSDVQAGTLMYVPVYGAGMATAAFAERRAALIGWAYSPYRMNDLMRGILDGRGFGHVRNVDLRIYDGGESSPAALLFDSQATARWPTASQLRQTRTIDFNGRSWRLEFAALPTQSEISYAPVFTVWAGGVTISGLLCGLLLALLNTRARAARIADSLIAEVGGRESRLRDSEAFKQAILNSVPAQIAVLDHAGVIVAINQPWTQFAVENGVEPGTPLSHTGVGADYLAVCRSTDAGADGDAAVAGIEAVLDGRLPAFNLEYPCHSPTRQRWFTMSVTPLGIAGRKGVVVTHTDISARKQAELAREEALRRLEKIAGRVPGVVFQYRLRADGSSCVPYASEVLREIYGVDPDAVVDDASAVFARVHPDDYPQHLASIAASAQDLSLWRNEYRVQAADGSHRWLLGSALPEREADGSTLWHGFISDITERKRDENALGEKTSLLESVINSSADYIFVKDCDLRTVLCNRIFAQALGKTPEQLYGKTDIENGWNPELVLGQAEDGIRGFQQDDLAALAGETVYSHGDLGNVGAEIRIFDSVKVPLRSADGKTIGILGISRDVTEVRRAEARMKQLAEEQRAILQSDVVGFVMLRGRVMLWMNPAFADMVGYTVEELAGQSTRVFYADDASYLAFRDAAYPVIQAGEVFRTQIQYRCKDGSPTWFDISGAQLHADSAESIWAFVDISAQKHSEAELVEARERAQQASLAKSRFLATMSHEIRTPMNSIFGMAQLLQMPLIDERERQDYARAILDAGQALLKLLNDVLDISKIEAGKLTLDRVLFAPAQLLESVRTAHAHSAALKGLALGAVWRSPAELAYVGDSFRLRQMLANLVGNAIKFTAHGGIDIEARELEGNETTAFLEFSVADTGIGIAADKQELLFLPFSQADSSTTRQYGGTGLGLSIVRTLARLMGGDAGLDSVPERGSRFWFRVRVARPAEPRRDDPPGAEPAPLPARLSGHVLVAEDHPDNRHVIGTLLGKLGLSVTAVVNGEQAVAAVMRGVAHDIVLMDVQMPVMDGHEASERIRRWEAENGRRRLPIVALTADAFEEDLARCRASGMDDFLVKPIDFDALRRVLGAWLAPAAAPDGAAAAAAAVDWQRAIGLIDTILPLLAHNRFDAVPRFKELSEMLTTTPVAPALNEIGDALSAFRFDLARRRLQELVAAQGWKTLP